MSIKSLGKQSLIYGFGHILARLVTFFLLPLYTHVFTPDEYGIISLAYAFMGFTLILYRYGMDTALMKYSVQLDGRERTVHITTIYGLQLFTSLIFSGLLFISKHHIALYVLGIDRPDWIAILSGILLMDALWNIPILILRTEEKPIPFIAYNFTNVLITMGLNIFFVITLEMGIQGVLLANLISSTILFILSVPIIINRIDIGGMKRSILSKVLRFALPFLPAGIFTMIMELSNRYLLEWLADTTAVGLFSAGYKLGVMGLIVVMGFNMGWTPYFLKRGTQPSARKEFAQIASIFLGLLGFVVVVVSLWIPEIIRISIGSRPLIGEQFWAAEHVIHVILLAYFFFGTYVIQLPGIYIKEITNWIPIFRAVGAIVNIGMNIYLIPIYGIIGSAWATVIAFVAMSSSIFLCTYKIYPIMYNWIACVYPILYMGIVLFTGDDILIRSITAFFYPIGWYFFAINSEERTIIKSFIA